MHLLLTRVVAHGIGVHGQKSELVQYKHTRSSDGYKADKNSIDIKYLYVI